MRFTPLFQRLRAALPREGEQRFKNDTTSMLITRHDVPFTIFSVLVKQEGHCGWITLQADAGKIESHHPRNVDLVEQALELFLGKSAAA
jgi:hypothetical protein